MRYLPVPKFRRLQWLPRRRWSRRKGLNGVQVDPFDSTREFCLKAVAWGALQLATNIPANIKWRSLFEAGTEREGRLGKEGGQHSAAPRELWNCHVLAICLAALSPVRSPKARGPAKRLLPRTGGNASNCAKLLIFLHGKTYGGGNRNRKSALHYPRRRSASPPNCT